MTSASGAGAGLAGVVGVVGVVLGCDGTCGLILVGAPGAAASWAQAASIVDNTRTRISPMLQSNVNFLFFTLDLQMILSLLMTF